MGRINLAPDDGCTAMYTRIAVNKAQRNRTLLPRVRTRPVAACRPVTVALASDAAGRDPMSPRADSLPVARAS